MLLKEHGNQQSDTQPNIAVSGPDTGGTAAWIMTSYAIRRQGGVPIRVQPKNFTHQAVEFDGLVIGGGTDIHPALYQSAPVAKSDSPFPWRYPLEWVDRLINHLTATSYDEDRDTLEIRLLKQAIDRGKPVFAICRGHQLVNAYLGGQLFQDTLPFYKEQGRIRSLLARKNVTLLTDRSQLAALVGARNLRVNALHNQAVAKPGKGFIATASEKNGLIQATEAIDKPILTVQWHPEYLPHRQQHRSLFAWLVRQARKVREHAAA